MADAYDDVSRHDPATFGPGAKANDCNREKRDRRQHEQKRGAPEHLGVFIPDEDVGRVETGVRHPVPIGRPHPANLGNQGLRAG